MPACARCGCTANDGDDAHRIVAALRIDDLDAAIEAGLLDEATCSNCTPECRAALAIAREDRHRALAARERYRDRALRLARRQHERDAARAPVRDATTPNAPALPPAAAAALARAKARAAQRKDGA